MSFSLATKDSLTRVMSFALACLMVKRDQWWPLYRLYQSSKIMSSATGRLTRLTSVHWAPFCLFCNVSSVIECLTRLKVNGDREHPWLRLSFKLHPFSERLHVYCVIWQVVFVDVALLVPLQAVLVCRNHSPSLWPSVPIIGRLPHVFWSP